MTLLRPFDVYAFRDSRELLSAYIAHKRKENRNFSINGWAKRLGLTSSGVLVNFIKRRRLPTEELLPRLAQSMGLNDDESEYVRTLVAWERATANESIGAVGLGRKLDGMIVNARTATIRKSEWDSASLLPFVAVKESLLLKDAPNTLKSLRERIAIALQDGEVERIADLLEKSGLFERLENGSFRPRKRHVQTETAPIPKTIREFHRQSLNHAIESIESVPTDQRYFKSGAIGIQTEKLPEIWKAIDEFHAEFIARFEAEPGTAESVYQLNLNCVPLTKTNPGKGNRK